jgi:hypothetical protein
VDGAVWHHGSNEPYHRLVVLQCFSELFDNENNMFIFVHLSLLIIFFKFTLLTKEFISALNMCVYVCVCVCVCSHCMHMYETRDNIFFWLYGIQVKGTERITHDVDCCLLGCDAV